MLRNLSVIVLVSIAGSQYAHADRVRVTSCPPTNDAEATFAGSMTYDGQNWVVLLDGFTKAEILRESSPAHLSCNYGSTNVGLQIPKQFKELTCSFEKNTIKPQLQCNALIPEYCVMYCERKI